MNNAPINYIFSGFFLNEKKNNNVCGVKPVLRMLNSHLNVN